MQLEGNNWFVKVDGRTRGPFSSDVIRSMKDRGRITIDSELSTDRQAWWPASEFEEFIFGEEPRVEDAIPTNEIAAGATQFFYNNHGVQAGPVTFAKLNEMAENGTLIGSDLVWYEGAVNWFPASSFTELNFRPDTATAKSWLARNRVLACCIAASLLALAIVPTWYVLRLNESRAQELRDQQDRKASVVIAARILVLEDKAKTLDSRLEQLKEDEQYALSVLDEGADARRRDKEIFIEMAKVKENIEKNTDEANTLQSRLRQLKEDEQNALNVLDEGADARKRHKEIVIEMTKVKENIEKNTDEVNALDSRLKQLKKDEQYALSVLDEGADARKRHKEIVIEMTKVKENIEKNTDEREAFEKELQVVNEPQPGSSAAKFAVAILGTLSSTVFAIAIFLYRAGLLGKKGDPTNDLAVERELFDARREIAEAKREITSAIDDLKR